MGKLNNVKSMCIALAVSAVFFQNCSQVNFNSLESLLSESDYLLMKVNGQPSVTLEKGQTYTVEVSGSEAVLANGLNPAESKLILIGGKATATNMQPWTLDANPASEVTAVSPLLNEGRSVDATAEIDLESLGYEIATPVIDVNIEFAPGGPIQVSDPTFQTNSAKYQNSTMAFAKVSSKTLIPQTEIINLGSAQFVYNDALEARLAGGRWLACVQSQLPKLESCVEFKTASNQNPVPVPPVSVVPPVPTTLPPVVTTSTTTTTPPPLVLNNKGNCLYQAFRLADELGVTKCLATGTNGTCSVTFSDSRITELSALPAGTVKALILNHNFSTNTSSGNLFQNGICADHSNDYPLRLQNDGKLVEFRHGGRKFHYTSATWTGGAINVTAAGGGWGGSGSRGCVDDINGFIEYGDATCKPCPIVPGVGPSCGP